MLILQQTIILYRNRRLALNTTGTSNTAVGANVRCKYYANNNTALVMSL